MVVAKVDVVKGRSMIGKGGKDDERTVWRSVRVKEPLSIF